MDLDVQFTGLDVEILILDELLQLLDRFLWNIATCAPYKQIWRITD